MFDSKPRLQTRGAQGAEHGQRILVELEVMRMCPRALHLDGCGIRVARPTHALDDPFREEHPDLLVVVQLWMSLQRCECRTSSLVVARRIELEPVAAPEAHVTVGAEVRAWSGDREIDVEDDSSEHGADDSLRR